MSQILRDLTEGQSFEVGKLEALVQTSPDEGQDTDKPERISSPSKHKRSAKPKSEVSSFCLGMDCRQRVYKWAYWLLGDQDDAEDLCQEICLRCLLGRVKFHGEAKFSSWLYRVMVNTGKDLLRKKCRDKEHIEQEIDAETLWEIWEAQSWERMATKEVQEKVQRALAKLTKRQQQLLMWKYVEGYTHAEIAQRLGITEQSAWQSLHRAKKAFKQAYEALDRDEATKTKGGKVRKG